MSAITLGFFVDSTTSPVILVGVESEIHLQLEQCQHWANHELAPVAGVIRIETWTAQGCRHRFGIPDGAPVDPEFKWQGNVAAEVNDVIAKISAEADATKAELEAVKAELETLKAAKGDGDFTKADPKGAKHKAKE